MNFIDMGYRIVDPPPPHLAVASGFSLVMFLSLQREAVGVSADPLHQGAHACSGPALASQRHPERPAISLSVFPRRQRHVQRCKTKKPFY